jgi:hypothetical protein
MPTQLTVPLLRAIILNGYRLRTVRVRSGAYERAPQCTIFESWCGIVSCITAMRSKHNKGDRE